MPPRVPIKERRLIARLFTEGVPQREICRRTGRSKTAVTRIIKAFRDDEGRLSDAKHSGRRRCTEQEDDMLIVAAAVADPFLNAREIREELGLDISCDTIRRRLKEAGLESRVAAQKPHVTERQRQQRLDFAREFQQWTVDDWSQVIFTDESTFCTRWDQKRRVWRPWNCRYGWLATSLTYRNSKKIRCYKIMMLKTAAERRLWQVTQLLYLSYRNYHFYHRRCLWYYSSIVYASSFNIKNKWFQHVLKPKRARYVSCSTTVSCLDFLSSLLLPIFYCLMANGKKKLNLAHGTS